MDMEDSNMDTDMVLEPIMLLQPIQLQTEDQNQIQSLDGQILDPDGNQILNQIPQNQTLDGLFFSPDENHDN